MEVVSLMFFLVFVEMCDMYLVVWLLKLFLLIMLILVIEIFFI